MLLFVIPGVSLLEASFLKIPGCRDPGGVTFQRINLSKIPGYIVCDPGGVTLKVKLLKIPGRCDPGGVTLKVNLKIPGCVVFCDLGGVTFRSKLLKDTGML